VRSQAELATPNDSNDCLDRRRFRSDGVAGQTRNLSDHVDSYNLPQAAGRRNAYLEIALPLATVRPGVARPVRETEAL